MDLKNIYISQKNYDVIRPSFDTLFKISVPIFVQIEIPNSMLLFTKNDATVPIRCFVSQGFYMFFTETHGKGLELVGHAPSD